MTIQDEVFILKATLDAPVMTSHPIHIDGLLLAMREDRDGPEVVGTPFHELASKDKVFHASAGFFVGSGLTPTRIVIHKTVRGMKFTGGRDDGRFSTEDRFINKMSPYYPKVGEYPTIEGAVAIVWQCRGDPEGCLSLARRIRGVGGRRNSGYGNIERWEVLPSEAPKETAGWRGSNGEVLRRLPMTWVEGPVPKGSMAVQGRVEAPYFAPDDHIEIVAPTVESLMGSGSAAERILSYS